MNIETRIKRDLKDYAIADKCNTCCLCCVKYNSSKEQNSECEPLKARGRIINREVKDAIKAKEAITDTI